VGLCAPHKPLRLGAILGNQEIILQVGKMFQGLTKAFVRTKVLFSLPFSKRAEVLPPALHPFFFEKKTQSKESF